MASDKDKNNVLYNNSKDILLHIFQKCKEESASGLRFPVELYEDRALDYTGTSKYVLDEITGTRATRAKSALDLFERAVICDSLNKMYSQRRSFTFKDIYEEVKDKVKNHELVTFSRDLRLLGYEYVNTLNYGRIVMEDPKYTFERYKYLSKMKKLRSQAHKTVYYLDERLIDLSRSFEKPWIATEDMTKIEGYVFFHIVSKQGFEKGLFCNKPTVEDLNKWVSDIVLTYLSQPSVIVMDKSPLHGERVNVPITRYHSKEEMLNWLQRNNIPCSASLQRAQLYELIARCPLQDTQYSLDMLFRSRGHEVLRLPEHYHDLSLTELLWEHVNTVPISGDCNNFLDFKKSIIETLKGIPHERWSQFESTIEATEQEFLAIDEAAEFALNPYKIDLKDVGVAGEA